MFVWQMLATCGSSESLCVREILLMRYRIPQGCWYVFVVRDCKLACKGTNYKYIPKMPTMMALPHQQNHTYYTKLRETKFLIRRSAAVFLVLFERSKST